MLVFEAMYAHKRRTSSPESLLPNKGKQAMKCSKVVANSLALSLDALLFISSSPLFVSLAGDIVFALSFPSEAYFDYSHWVTCQ